MRVTGYVRYGLYLKKPGEPRIAAQTRGVQYSHDRAGSGARGSGTRGGGGTGWCVPVYPPVVRVRPTLQQGPKP